MSMSVEGLGQRLYYAAVPLVLIIGILIAVWMALFSDSEKKSQGLNLPFFDYQAPENVPVYSDILLNRTSVQPVRDIFLMDSISGKQENLLELHEVALGMVILKGEKRFCLTNGELFKEGESGNAFTVRRIESNGVWYQIGQKEIFLQAGEKVNVDSEGNVRE